MEQLEIVNKRLKDNYGLGHNLFPRYRVVFGRGQLETRTGVFDKFSPAGLWLGTEITTKEVEKYPDWQEYWILEQVLPNILNTELKAEHSYEPLFIFKNARNNQPLPYDWEIIEVVVYFHIHKSMPKNQSMIDHQIEEDKLLESAQIEDELKSDSVMPNRMYDTPLITVPSKQFGSEDNV